MRENSYIASVLTFPAHCSIRKYGSYELRFNLKSYSAALLGWLGHAVGQLVKAPGNFDPVAWLAWGWDIKVDGWPTVLGRAGLILGAFAGLSHRGKALHDERHVHGLEVAAGSPEKGTRRWASESDLAHVAERESRPLVATVWDALRSPAWGPGVRKTETRSVVRRPLMTPEELAGMDPLAAVCLVRWALPVYLQKVGWEELPQAKEIKALAAKSLAEVCPARPDVRVELPPVPEGAPPEPKKRDRAQERGADTRAVPLVVPDEGASLTKEELEELGL
jgi:hypothetical protein